MSKEYQKSLREQIKAFEAGEYDTKDVDTQIDAGWYDWFCKDTSLPLKTTYLFKKVLSILDSKKIDLDKHYVFFKNNCPVQGQLYDDFRICDLETGEVIYCVTPNRKVKITTGYAHIECHADVYGKENDFQESLIDGRSWKDVKNFFLK